MLGRKSVLCWSLFVLYSTLNVYALIVKAPEECGGQRVVVHASAEFALIVKTNPAIDIPAFAAQPREQQNSGANRVIGEFSSSSGKQRKKDKVLLHYLLTRTPWTTKLGTKSLFGLLQDQGEEVTPTIELLNDGCKAFRGKDLEGVRDKVAILKRDQNCDLETKVYNMQNAGAMGVVIVNYESSPDAVCNMKLNVSKQHTEFHIPAVMIAYRDWRALAPCRNENITISFTVDGEATFDIDYGKNVLTWAMLRGMALWILLQGVNAVRYKRRHRDLTARTEAISKMRSFTFGSEQSGSSQSAAPEVADQQPDEPICAICLDGFVVGDQARRLECTHLYHKSCIDPWLVQSSACPVCKREIADLPPPRPHFYGSVSAV